MGHHHKVTFKSVLKSVGNGFKSVAHEGEHLANKVLDVPKEALHTVSSLGGELALPLLLLGGIAVVVYINNR